ncbi:CLUMA_CG012749, isoform A [Clunio marinus]|uniref:CLUMA_CG012749, isoform A n=1 Tax=Clunio marinus TaxID=568069 RepID=A0A1J1ILI5_9DIPT|nr:CLUMA_CG012749, isoform A [Clunio marinus]
MERHITREEDDGLQSLKQLYLVTAQIDLDSDEKGWLENLSRIMSHYETIASVATSNNLD